MNTQVMVPVKALHVASNTVALVAGALTLTNSATVLDPTSKDLIGRTN